LRYFSAFDTRRNAIPVVPRDIKENIPEAYLRHKIVLVITKDVLEAEAGGSGESE
jgi:hypothetical protein